MSTYPAHLDYDQYKQKIRKFRRDDLMIQSSFLSWKAWGFDGPLETRDKMDRVLVRAHAPRVFAISAATGTNFNRELPHGTNGLMLCRGFLDVTDSISDQRFLAEEKERLIASVRRAPLLQTLNLDDEIIGSTAAGLFVMRLVRSQWDAEAYSYRHISRSWLIYKTLCDQTDPGIRDAVAEILQQTDIDAVRSAVGLFTMFTIREIENFSRAFLNIDGSTCDAEITDRLNIDLNTMEIAASRLSIGPDRVKEWHAQAIQQPERYKKYYPLPFYSHPLIAGQEYELPITGGDSDSFYICPSPNMLLAGASSWIFRLINENRDLFVPYGVGDPLVAFGNATEEYLHLVLGRIFGTERITRITDRLTRNADFIVDLDQCILVIECKKSINNRLTRSVLAPEDAVMVWERMTDALLQCSGTIVSNPAVFENASKPTICLVVADDVILGEDGVFAYLAETSGFLSRSGIDFFEVMSLDVFETMFSFRDHNLIVQKCVEKWTQFRQRCHFQYWTPLAFADFGRRPAGNLPHLREAISEILPIQTNARDLDLEEENGTQ